MSRPSLHLLVGLDLLEQFLAQFIRLGDLLGGHVFGETITS